MHGAELTRILLAAALWAATASPVTATAGRSLPPATPTADGSDSLQVELRLAPGELWARLSFPAAPVDSLVLELPAWAGVADFHEEVRDLRATDEAGAPLEVRPSEEGRWVVEGTRVPFSIRYVIGTRKTSFVGADRSDIFRPTLLQDWAFVWGHAWLIRPVEDPWPGRPVHLRVDAGSFGSTWVSGPEDGGFRDLDSLAESLLVAGAYRPRFAEVAGKRVRFLLRGSWGFTDETFVEALGRIFQRQALDMGSYPGPELMVVLVEGSASSSGGTVDGGAIALYPPAGATLGSAGLGTLRLVAHEHFHIWNGDYARPTAAAGEGRYKWFQEGLTEYVAERTLLRAGLSTPEDFIHRVNHVIRDYESNPVARTASADVLERRYWEDPDHQQLPYLKGFLLALWIDARVRRVTSDRRDLDDVLRAVLRQSTDSTGVSYDDARLRQALRETTGGDWSTLYEEGVLGSSPLPLWEICSEAGLVCRREPVRLFDLGFSVEGGRLERGARVLSVAPGSPAEAAGLARGETLAGFSFWRGDPDRKAVVQVSRGGDVVDLEYVPARVVELIQVAPVDGSLGAVRRLGRAAGPPP